jgi:Ca2+-binding RTX toxin-like protein
MLLFLVAVGGLVPVLTGTASANPNELVPECTIRGSGVVIGTPGNDVICGSGESDSLIGLGGDDVLRGFGGDDLLVGGRGLDRLYGGRGNDLLVDATGALVEDGGPGRDRCIGQGQVAFEACEYARNVGVRLANRSIVIRQP